MQILTGDASGSTLTSDPVVVRFPVDRTVATDIGSPAQVMRLQASSTGGNPTTFTVQWSPDGTTWFDGYDRTIYGAVTISDNTGGGAADQNTGTAIAAVAGGGGTTVATLAEIKDTLTVAAGATAAETFTIKGDHVRVSTTASGGNSVSVWIN